MEIDIPGMDEEKLRAQFTRDYNQARDHWREWRTEARDLFDAVAGRQWDEIDLAKMRDEERPAVTFNLLGKFLDVILGLQINNRQDIRYYPRENGDAAVNEVMTGAADWARDQCDAQDEESDAFYDACLTGLGWMEWYLDDEADGSPLPAGRRCDPLENYPDPKARAKGMKDARFHIRVKSMSKEEYEDTFNEDPEENAGSEGTTVGADDDTEIRIIPAHHDYPEEDTMGMKTHGLIAVADYQFWKREDAWNVTADLTMLGQGPVSKEFSKADWAKLEPLVKAKGLTYKAEKKKQKVYYRAFIAPTGVKQAGRNPYQKGFTYHAITGKRDRNKNVWYGLGRPLLQPQMWVNKFFSSILFTLMTNAKGGLLAEESAFADQRKAEDNWAKPNSITYAADGALQNNRVMPKPQASYPQGMDRLMSFSMEALPSVSGLNLEIMGLTDRVQAGVVEAQRKQSAMAIIAWAFDAMRRYYRSAGRQIATYIADYVPEGTLIRVTADTGKQYVPLTKDKSTLPYDVIVDEAPTSTNMKERVWLVLQSLLPQLLQAGLPIPPEVLDYSPLPPDLAEAWKKIMQDPQKQQMGQRGQAAQVAGQEAKVTDLQAAAALKKAQAQKTQAETGHTAAKTETEKYAGVEQAAKAGAAQGGM